MFDMVLESGLGRIMHGYEGGGVGIGYVFDMVLERGLGRIMHGYAINGRTRGETGAGGGPLDRGQGGLGKG